MADTVPVTEVSLVVAPVPNAAEYTVSAEMWQVLTNEIDYVVGRIKAGENLVPEDVEKVRTLKNQVENYLTAFNRAMRDAQANYKKLIADQLDRLGYNIIEDYIQVQRKKQTEEQNARLAQKQNQLQEIVSKMLEGTKALKHTVLSGQLLPAFTSRFPNINSAAKSKEIKNWGPYEAVVSTTGNMLDVFFMDPVFEGAATLPITSATMQQLLAYVRDGNIEHLTKMREVFAKDAEYLKVQTLKAEITTKETALAKIAQIISQGMDVDTKVQDIARIIRIAETL